LIVAAVTGLLVGAGVYGFEWLVLWILVRVRSAPTPLMVLGPAAGLAMAAVALRVGPLPRSRSTADEYLIAVHDPTHRIPPRQVGARLAAAVATLGLGGALGLEGPAVLLGAGAADETSRRIGKRLRVDSQALLVAGVAAAVAAVFKAPATGAVFAMEVPFRNDLARHRLLPALVGAASGYLCLVTLAGPSRLFPVLDNPPFDLVDLGGALLLGVAAGVVARGVARAIRWAKHWAASTPAAVRVPVAAVVLASAAWLAWLLTSEPLGIGPGYLVIDWLEHQHLSISLLGAVLVLRFASVVATTGGGGVGGFFVPLVVLGAILGRLAAAVTGTASSGLFPILGVAALLGAGYGVPLAAVMFVAETSGRPAYVVPALLAAVAADLASGTDVVTDYQRAR
jgi:CIC family chloride channel protein